MSFKIIPTSRLSEIEAPLNHNNRGANKSNIVASYDLNSRGIFVDKDDKMIHEPNIKIGEMHMSHHYDNRAHKNDLNRYKSKTIDSQDSIYRPRSITHWQTAVTKANKKEHTSIAG